MPRREGAALLCAFLAPCALAAALAARDLEVPGLYYDEVIQAEPAVQFLAENGRPSEVPGVRSVRLFGRWFPLMTQTYMGALKSQLLVPVFALFGATPTSLRLATLAVSLIGLLATLLWARQTLGLPVALLAGALLACDPSFLFTSRHDWGAFSVGFACRCAGLQLLTSGWRRRRNGSLFGGGLLLGLGVYNKIDFSLFAMAAVAALLVAAPRVALDAFRGQRPRLFAAAIGFSLGAAPMIAALRGALAATRVVLRSSETAGFDWSEKLHAMATVLDGSYFHRLMLAGGRFESMFAVQGAHSGPFLALFLASAVLLGMRLLRRSPRSDADRAQAFALVTSLLTLLGVFLTPRAERIHHFLNAYPFPHLVAAISIAGLWKAAPRGALRAALRATAVAVAGGVLAASIHLSGRTLETIRDTGGKGRWSDALTVLAAELEREPGAGVVSLDWGFDGPLRFVARGLQLAEPIWTLLRPPAPDSTWRLRGSPRFVYLLYPEEYAVFGFGASFLEAVRELPPESVEIRRHPDRTGDTAFLSVRFTRGHELVYRGGAFRVRLR